MEPRQDLVERSAPFLPEGSEIKQVFICQAAPNFAFFLLTYMTGLTIFRIKYRCVPSMCQSRNECPWTHVHGLGVCDASIGWCT
jgi:hypothetical protein